MARPKHGTHALPTEERILKAAESEFGKYGFERTRLEDIAKLAGIRRPSLLYHFKTKSLLYSSVVHRAFDSLRMVLVARMRPGEFTEQVNNLVCGLEEYVQSNPAFAPIVLREIINGNGPARDILINEMDPLLSVVELWLKQQGGDNIPKDISVRYAVLNTAINILFYAASKDLAPIMWGKINSSKETAQRLFIR